MARSPASGGRSLILTLPLRLPGAGGLPGRAAWPAQRPPRPQAGRQLAAQRPAALDIQGLVDGLVRHPHLRLVREVDQPGGVTDLPRRPLLASSQCSTRARSTGSASQPGRLRPPRPVLRRGLRPRARYRPLVVRFRATSRQIVDAGRPSCRAMARNGWPAARPTAISSRSATPRYRRPTGRVPLAFTPPACRNHTSAVCSGSPHRGRRHPPGHPRPDQLPELRPHHPRQPRPPTFSTTTTPSTIKPLQPPLETALQALQ